MITGGEVILIIGMATVTFLARYPLLVIVGRIDLPRNVFNALKYVPVAVLTAIIVPAALLPDGTLDLSPANAYLYAGIISVVISWRTRNLLLTIIGGMVVFLLWRALIG